MFPPANATVYRNEAGEPVGWDIEPDDPPEPHDPDGEPYDPDEVVDIWIGLDAAGFTAYIAAQEAEGYSGITLPGRMHWKVLRAIDRGAEDVTVLTRDGATWIGTVQDYDLNRAEVTIELR